MSRALVAAAVATALSPSPEAGVARGLLQIRLEVPKSCTVSALALSPRGAPISVDCTKDTPYSVDIALPAARGEPVTVTVHY